MAKKGNGHHKRGLPKTVGGWFSLSFKLLGAGVVASPAIIQIKNQLDGGTPEQIPAAVMAGYTGYDPSTGAFSVAELEGGIAAIVGGIVLAKVGTIVGRMLR